MRFDKLSKKAAAALMVANIETKADLRAKMQDPESRVNKILSDDVKKEINEWLLWTASKATRKKK